MHGENSHARAFLDASLHGDASMRSVMPEVCILPPREANAVPGKTEDAEEDFQRTLR